MTADSRATPLGPVLAIGGGALLAIGSFLTWVTVNVRAQGVTDSSTSTGIDVDDGWITLAAGIALVAAGLVNLRTPRRALALLAVFVGVLGLALGVWEIVTVEDRALDAFAEEQASQFGISAEEFRALLDAAAEQGELDIDISGGIGLYLVLAGGAAGIAGGALQLSRARSTAPAGTEPVPSMTTPTTSAPGDFPPPAPTTRPPDNPSV